MAVLAWLLAVDSASAVIQAVGLKCEYAVDPLGMDVAAPRLSWRLESNERDQQQRAYQILVAASETTLERDKGDLWDSGKVASDVSLHVAYLSRKAKFNIVGFGLGDWYDLGPKPPGFAQLTLRELTATAFYHHDTWILAQTARLLGREAEAKQFAGKADEIRAAFNAKFYDRSKRSYSTGSQCANAIPLVMNLCE